MPTAEGFALIKDMGERNGARAREVFARYGLAMFYAQDFESQLAVLIHICETVHKGPAQGEGLGHGVSLDALWKLTLGQLLTKNPKRLAIRPGWLGANEAAVCTEAVTVRNTLAHEFWRSAGDNMATADGMQELCDWLDGARELFVRARAASLTMALRVSQPEWSEEQLRTESDRLTADVRGRLLPGWPPSPDGRLANPWSRFAHAMV